MTGGVNAVMGTLYDSGTVTVTINGHAANASYGQSSSSSSLAAAIASATQSASAGGLTATASGSTVSLKSVAEGSATNWPISISVSYNTANFSAASFSATGSGMSGGANATQSTGTLYSFGVQHAPDGQLKQSTDLINGTWNYTYDDFNRLLTANEVNSSNTVINGLSWDYDRYGNRWHQNLTAGTGTTHNLVFNAANQATTNLAYDNSGNVHTDSSHTYTYDAENRIEQVDGGISYIYDAEGRRVGKSNGTVYVVGLSGQVLDELDSGSWTSSEVYADGHHIATVTPSTVYFVHTDWLGTERVRTNMAGQVCESITSEPFGENVVTSTPSGVTGCNPTPDFFTGKQRDTESNLDDFGARYFSSQWGRWMSPDWSASPTEVPYSTLANPQSLNLYAYVGNDPIVGEDPDGHFTFGFGDNTNDGDNNDAGQRATEAGKDQSTTPASEKPAAQQQANSETQQQSPKTDAGNVTYKPGVPKASPAVSDMLICTAHCSDENLRVTSTSEAIPQHPEGTPHRKGEAADVTVKPGTEKRVLKCAASCGAKFGQDEGAHPIPGHTTGPHIHLQTVPGRLGGRGELPRDPDKPPTQ